MKNLEIKCEPNMLVQLACVTYIRSFQIFSVDPYHESLFWFMMYVCSLESLNSFLK